MNLTTASPTSPTADISLVQGSPKSGGPSLSGVWRWTLLHKQFLIVTGCFLGLGALNETFLAGGWHLWLRWFARVAVGAVILTIVWRANRRAREIENKAAELEASVHRAMAANREKDQFLSTLSKALRQPMAAITGYTQLLDMELYGPLTTQQREYLVRIAHNSEHLLGAVNGILDYAKHNNASETLDIHPVQAVKIVRDVSQSVADFAKDKQVKIEALVTGSCWTMVDEYHFRKTLLNLVLNAIQHSYPGGTVRIILSQTTDTLAKISVVDKGVGIPDDYQENIFHAFNTMLSSVGGRTSLARSRELIRRMGGNLTVNSELGEGSTFTLWLPVCSDTEKVA